MRRRSGGSGEALGNFLQAFSAAFNLDRALGQKK
jgi:hypothetical protein